MLFIKRHWLLFLGLGLVLPVIWPLFRQDFFLMHDWTHVARLVELDLALKLGQIPPRWAPDFGWGYGMPLFHFYPPLPYYLAELFHLIKLPAVWSIKLIFALNYLAGFYFMYLWAKTKWGKIGGIFSATAFLYLPYRAVQFYVRGSLGELTAMTFLPLLFYGLKKKNLILSATAWAAVFLSHNVIALFSLLFIPLYFLFNLKSWRQFILISVFTFGLSAFFILPAFFERNLTIVDSLTGGYFDYRLHFIYLRQLWQRSWGFGGSIFGLEDNISFQLGWPHILMVLPAFLFWKKNLYIFFSLAISIFLMTFHSQFIWDRIPLLAMAQFPWRLLVFSGVFVAFLSGSVVRLIKQKFLLFSFIIIIVGLNFNYFRPEKFSLPEDYYYTDRQRIANEMSDILFDYLPKNAQKPTSPRSLDSPLQQFDFLTVSVNSEGKLQFKKTPIQLWSDIISLISWFILIIYVIRSFRIRA